MLHFLIGGVCIALLLSLQPEDELPRIRVDETKVSSLIAAARLEARNPRDAVDTHELVAKHIREELIYQQAIKYEFYRNESLRAILIQEMKKHLEPVIAVPTDDQLRTFLSDNKEVYRAHPTVSFEHVSWPTGNKATPENLLERLQAGEAPAEFGHPVHIANPMPVTLLPILKRKLGEEAAVEVMNCPVNEWCGPIHSKLGSHFVRVTSKNPTGEQPFEKLAVILKNHWMRDQAEQAFEKSLQQIAEEYEIEAPEAYKDALP